MVGNHSDGLCRNLCFQEMLAEDLINDEFGAPSESNANNVQRTCIGRSEQPLIMSNPDDTIDLEDEHR